MNDLSNIFFILKLIRRAKKIKAKKAAGAIKCSPTFLSLAENGKKNPSFDLVSRYADYLGYEVVLSLKPKEVKDDV